MIVIFVFNLKIFVFADFLAMYNYIQKNNNNYPYNIDNYKLGHEQIVTVMPFLCFIMHLMRFEV